MQVEGGLLPGSIPLGEEMPQPWWEVGYGVHLFPQIKGLPVASREQKQNRQLSALAGTCCASVGDPGANPTRVVPPPPGRSPGASLHPWVPPPTRCLQTLTQLCSWGLNRKTSVAP